MLNRLRIAMQFNEISFALFLMLNAKTNAKSFYTIINFHLKALSVVSFYSENCNAHIFLLDYQLLLFFFQKNPSMRTVAVSNKQWESDVTRLV